VRQSPRLSGSSDQGNPGSARSLQHSGHHGRVLSHAPGHAASGIGDGRSALRPVTVNKCVRGPRTVVVVLSYLTYTLQNQRKKRADERTRTADLETHYKCAGHQLSCQAEWTSVFGSTRHCRKTCRATPLFFRHAPAPVAEPRPESVRRVEGGLYPLTCTSPTAICSASRAGRRRLKGRRCCVRASCTPVSAAPVRSSAIIPTRMGPPNKLVQSKNSIYLSC
jgi:hypothetical protein